MAGFMKNAMSYLGMTDVVDDDDPVLDEEPAESVVRFGSFGHADDFERVVRYLRGLP